MSDPQRRELVVALQQFVAEASPLSAAGEYMRYEDGQPVAVQIALAQLMIDLLAKGQP